MLLRLVDKRMNWCEMHTMELWVVRRLEHVVVRKEIHIADQYYFTYAWPPNEA